MKKFLAPHLIVYKFHKLLNISESKKKNKDQKSIQSSTTPDPGYQWESDNFTTRHHKREPAGDHKASKNRRARKSTIEIQV